MRGYVVAGIGTEVGKTVVSAILVEKLRADYWKPVQAGNLDASDTLRVRQLTRHGGVLHPEAWRLDTPMSPHAAAVIDGVAHSFSINSPWIFRESLIGYTRCFGFLPLSIAP